MPPIVVHQAKEYYQDLHHNIPLEWKVNNTPSGYIYIYEWIQAMNQFSNTCGDSPVNNKILFFDGNDIHFDERTLTQMQRKKSSPSYLKRVTPFMTSQMTTGLIQN